MSCLIWIYAVFTLISDAKICECIVVHLFISSSDNYQWNPTTDAGEPRQKQAVTRRKLWARKQIKEVYRTIWSQGKGKANSHFMSPLPEIANFSTKYFILSKVYTDEGGVK